MTGFWLLWIAAIAAQTCLVILTGVRSILPWFRLWLYATLTTQIIALLLRNHGTWYDPFWRGSAAVLGILLALVVAESARYLDSPIVRRALLLAGFSAAIVHILLKSPLRWPDSDLELVFSAFALVQLVLCLFLAQLWAYGGARYQSHALILTLYMAGKSICYYSASTFPQTIGRATQGVELIATISWLTILASE